MLKKAIRDALTDLQCEFPFFGNDRVEVNVHFNIFRENKDLDNMEKLILDALSNIVYSEDKKVRIIYAKKDDTNVVGSTDLIIRPI